MDTASACITLFEDGDQRTDCLEGQVAWQGSQLAVEFGGAQFGVSPESVERATVVDLPRPFPKQFDHGVLIQWTVSGKQRQVVLETERTVLLDLLEQLCGACLDGVEVRVEQRIAPRQPDDGAEPKTVTDTTPIAVDLSERVVRFEAEELHGIQPASVTTAETGSFELDGTTLTTGRIKMLTPEREIVTRVVPTSSRIGQILCDFTVGVFALTGTGGPISVLFVDDEPALTDLAQLQMKKHHKELSIQAATSTEYATQLLETDSFECVVSDYEMPDGGAAELLSASQADGRSLPFVVLSRWEEDDIPAEERPPGIDAWMQKETGTDQYHRLGELVKRLVVKRRSSE